MKIQDHPNWKQLDWVEQVMLEVEFGNRNFKGIEELEQAIANWAEETS